MSRVCLPDSSRMALRVPRRLLEALDAAAASSLRGRSELARQLLRISLEGLGFWPPPPRDSNGGAADGR